MCIRDRLGTALRTRKVELGAEAIAAAVAAVRAKGMSGVSVNMSTWLFFSGTEAILCLTPGPAALFVVACGLAQGGRALVSARNRLIRT